MVASPDRSGCWCLVALATSVHLGGCDAPDPAPRETPPAAVGSSSTVTAGVASSSADAAAAIDREMPAVPTDGGPPGATASASPLVPFATQAELLTLVSLPPGTRELDQRGSAFLRRAIEPGSFGAMNQGNPAIARHDISRRQCLQGLRELTLQTAEQRRICRGYDFMVPIYDDGHPEHATACIDVFEFPNRPCELPFVWASATQARGVCRALGKRLCTQQEWVQACSADPAGGAPSTYAYGDELDLTRCNTNKRKRDYQDMPCDPTTVQSTWKTCGTHTDPAGAHPGCRSRLGVFDQHGNVAEAMTRYDREQERTVSQLKGSAFFYVDVHRSVDGPPAKETYPDNCAHDPRWHVQPMSRAWHVNYHLGFRCCLELR